MPDYQQLTLNELLNLARQREQLTHEARYLLDSEIARRNISADEIRAHSRQIQASEQAEERKRTRLTRRRYRQFLGKKNFHSDQRRRVEEFDTTLWFIVGIPLVPISSHRVRRPSRNWWTLCPSDTIHILKTKPRDWQQILVTWCKTAAVILLLVVLATMNTYRH